MILYSSNAIDFRNSVDNNTIVERIEDSYTKAFGKRPAVAEKRAWNNSMRFMESIVRNSNVADDCGVLIEFTVPATSKRVDFIISGQNEKKEKNFVIVELKQWDEAEATDREDVVVAFVGGRHRDMAHPSYQACSYKQMLDDMNTAIQINSLHSYACSYLHNYNEKSPEPLKSQQYADIIDITPIFLKRDTEKLQNFISMYVSKGNGMDILYQIENGEIKPSKKLIECVASVFQGNKEFLLLDEQLVAYSTILNYAKQTDIKRTIIVKGGPGTGKSVVSMNAFGQLLQYGMNVRFVAPNAAFRNVVLEYLIVNAARNDKGRIRNLFSGSAQFINKQPDLFDVLVVDEAHRLKGAGAYQYQGENQVEDIIRASRVNVFFIDDSQRVRPEDIGSVNEIKRVAESLHSEIYEIALNAQFRCVGAEGYVNWLDSVLQIRETGNFNGWDKQSFEFRVVDNPNKLKQLIIEKNQSGLNARLLAGFAWDWTDEKRGNRHGGIDDVVIPEYGFSMPWNSRANRELWAIRSEGLKQIGCIHTSQGLEFDYVGVIIGSDLTFDPDRKSLIASYDDYKDRPGKKGLRYKNRELTELICNIYKTLMSRGMKGCYIFCVDKNLQEHFIERLNSTEVPSS